MGVRKLVKNLRLSTLVLLGAATMLVAGTILVSIAIQTSKNVSVVERSWKEYQANRSEKARLESVLRSTIGYGGMIHEFKNFVLRRDAAVVETIHQKISLAAGAIVRYEALGPTEAEKLALEDIGGMLSAYELALQKSEKLALEGRSAAEIDAAVKVDDELALRGLAVIDKEIAYQAEESSREVTRSLVRATNLLGIATWGTVVLIFVVTATLSWTMRSMVILPIQHMTHLMTRLATDRLDVKVPATRQKNEIGEMARALEVFRENAIKRRIAEAEIRQMTLVDGLTGVANRKRFDIRLLEIVQLCKRMDVTAALLMIDLDGFKAVNDTLGHHAGDEFLKVAAERMLHVTREVDIVARLGGDEFAIILLGMDSPEDAEIPARRLIEDIERVTMIGDVEVKISASVGIRMLSPDDEDIDMIMRQADAAMYSVKRAGRGHFAFFGQRLLAEGSHEKQAVGLPQG